MVCMNVTVAEAAKNLEEILQRAEEGDEVVITRNGHAAIQLVRVEQPGEAAPVEKLWREMSMEERHAVLREIRESGARHAVPGPSAARSQDFLYDENGLPA